MENRYQQHIGVLLHFNESSFKDSLNAWGKVKPAVLALKEIYEGLGLGAFTQETLTVLLNSGTQSFEDAYMNAVKTDIKSMKFKTNIASAEFLKTSKESLASLISKRQELIRTFDEAATSRSFYGIILNWEHAQYIDGELIINEEEIKKATSLFVESSKQAELYGRLIELKEKFDSLTDYLSDCGVPQGAVVFDGNGGMQNGLIYIQDRKMKFNHTAIKIA